MKFIKRISLFFIYPITMFGVGFAANMFMQEIFYPGEQKMPERAPVEEEYQMKEVSVSGEQIITADTEYVMIYQNADNGEFEEVTEVTPDKYIGLTREKLEEELALYSKSPSLTDLEKGFTYIELLSFAPSRIVIRKGYEKKAEEEGFFLVNENHYVAVYDRSLKYLYMSTDIITDELPQQLQDEIIHMKFIENENELYNFLESYSS